MSDGMFVLLSGLFKFGVLLGICIHQLLTTPRPGGGSWGRPAPAAPPPLAPDQGLRPTLPSTLPPTGHAPPKPLPDCLVPKPAPVPVPARERERELA